MKKHHLKTVGIATGQGRPPLSKVQKAFNSLIRQIDRKRAELAAWEAAIPPFQSQYASELVPLYEESLDLQARMVQGLDRASDQKGLTKGERRKIAALITELAGTLVAARNDEQMKALYNKHGQFDYDSEEMANASGMKSMLEHVLGFDMGDDLDLGSPETILERARSKLEEQQAQFEADRQAGKDPRTGRKQSAKQLAREARREADEQKLRQSIREIYRKLTSALHPDREPDPRERERKTGLMQRANQAYEKNNLLQLLELQLELEHIDQTAIDNIAEDRLKDYNKILSGQSLELEMEIRRVASGFREQFGISPFIDVMPGSIMKHLAVEIGNTRRALREVQQDLHAIEDLKKLKAWLRRTQLHETDDFSDVPF
ncbi:MAG: molecular chaperone DnaJ [Betaproteobacteria bacterium]|nr:molecular chaperone DnaJ [Betaproteobacteria bacterium]